MSSGNCLQLFFLLITAAIVYYSNAAPAACRTCTNGSCNNTDDEVADFDSTSTHNRTKRESTVEQRSCVQFQLEMVLIPLSIAMIPVGLCALLLCACCCGPEESRGKMPDRFTKKGNTSSKKEVNEIDDVELVCKDGVVMRRDSKKTRFSTAVSIIEARRISIDILDDRRPSLFSIGPKDSEESLNSEQAAQSTSQTTQPPNCQQQQPAHSDDNQSPPDPNGGTEVAHKRSEMAPSGQPPRRGLVPNGVTVMVAM